METRTARDALIHAERRMDGHDEERQQALLTTMLTRLAQLPSKCSYKSNTALSQSPSNSVNYSWVRSLHQKHCNELSKNNSLQKMCCSPLPYSLLFCPRAVFFLTLFFCIGWLFLWLLCWVLTLLDCFFFSSTWKNLTQAFHV